MTNALNAIEFDSPWKEAFRRFLRSFLRLCFPQVEQAIDWSCPPQFLDKELQQIIRDADAGKRYVDLLVQVRLLDGTDNWILLHIEVQHRAEEGFGQRLFRYNYRALDVYSIPVATLVVLADTNPHWRPTHYELVVPGTRVRFDFSVCKLLDLVADEQALRASREPAAIVVLANWAVQQAGKDAQRRMALKWDLTRRLYEIGLEKADILELYRLVDWLIRLPQDLEKQFHQRLYEFEAERTMPYVTSAERFGIEKGIRQGIEQGIERGIEQGIEQGIQQGIERGIEQGMKKGQIAACRENLLTLLEARFGVVPEAMRERVEAETDLERLKNWLRQAGTSAGLAAIGIV